MRKLLAATASALIVASTMAIGQTQQLFPGSDSGSIETAQGADETPQMWMVELSSPPAAEGTATGSLEREEADFHNAARSAGIKYAKRRHFRDLWNGVTVRASGRDVAKLRALPGVRAVYPVMKIRVAQLEEQAANTADLVSALRMTGADVAQSALGLSGRGIRVAVMDSGIDYDHPDLGGCFGPGCRVVTGYDFVGDDYNSSGATEAELVPRPDNDPDDCPRPITSADATGGHGTHVAGIVGARGAINGVAPNVTFGAYRVFGCVGTTDSDIMIAAMERVRRDRMDVLNMSIGSPFEWPESPTARAANLLVKHGIVVVASIGNQGPAGLYAASAPGVGRDVIGVASFDNTHVVVPYFTVSPDNTAISYDPATGAPPPPVSGSSPMTRTATAATINNDACAALPAGSLAGTVALIRRGTCSFYQKSFNAQSAGAIGVVLYNNTSGRLPATVAGEPPITIPVVGITAANGTLISNRLAAGPVTMTWKSGNITEEQPTGNLISSFSSWGAAADLTPKPDLGAPGGSIRSTLPLEIGGYGSYSGTSMAAPHTAGAVALMLEAAERRIFRSVDEDRGRDWDGRGGDSRGFAGSNDRGSGRGPAVDPREILTRLQNTAEPRLWFGNPGLGFLDNVHRQGAGMIQVDDAILAPAIVTPGRLALGELEAGAPARKFIRVTRNKLGNTDHGPRRGRPDAPITYTLSHAPALATGPSTFAPAFLLADATVQFGTPKVRLGMGDDTWVSLLITPPAVPPPPQTPPRLFGGYIVLTPDDDSAVLRVPYVGYNGDYQAIQVLTPTPAGLPWLAKLNEGSFEQQEDGASYTLQGDDVPFLLAHFDHQSRVLKAEVFAAGVAGRSHDLAFTEEFMPRNATPTGFFAFAWDGTTSKRAGGRARPVPNGTYIIKMTVLKALGNPANPAHTEQWESPVFTIARPAP